MTFDVSAVCAFCEQTVASKRVSEAKVLEAMQTMERKRCDAHKFALIIRHCRRSDAPPPKVAQRRWQSAKGKTGPKSGGSKGHRRGVPSSY